MNVIVTMGIVKQGSMEFVFKNFDEALDFIKQAYSHSEEKVYFEIEKEEEENW